jgi:CubicO group peptidase (beta-lactamase class C family)
LHTRITIYMLISVSLTILISGCGGEPLTANPASATIVPTEEQPAYWPDPEWRVSSPEEQGIDSARILSMLQEIQQKDLNIHSVLVIRHGYLVTEVYFPPYTREIKHPVYSMTKSVTSAMTGIAIRNGQIKNVRQNVLDFFPEIALETKDQYLQDMTVEHLLTMSAGFNTSTLPDFSDKDASFDSARHILTYDSVLSKPGETFFYDSGLPHLMSAIIQKTSGLTLEAYAKTDLFGPLGITDYGWQSDPQGITTGNSGLVLRPGDMAKLGYLYLHDGQWNGSQIVPARWVRASTSVHMKTKGLMNAAEDDGYGYYWWIDSFGGYSAHGFGGQYVFVLPGQDMVVVFTGGLPDPDFPAPHELLKTYLLPAAQSAQPLAANPQMDDRLTTEIRNIQDTEMPGMPLPDIARRISGKTYRLIGIPPAGWPTEITFTFSGDDTYTNSTLLANGGILTVTGGLKNVFFMNRLGPQGSTLMPFRGYWRDERTFVEEQNFGLTSDIQFFTVTYIFDGKKVSVTVDSSMDYFPTLTGTGEMIE